MNKCAYALPGNADPVSVDLGTRTRRDVVTKCGAEPNAKDTNAEHVPGAGSSGERIACAVSGVHTTVVAGLTAPDRIGEVPSEPMGDGGLLHWPPMYRTISLSGSKYQPERLSGGTNICQPVEHEISLRGQTHLYNLRTASRSRHNRECKTGQTHAESFASSSLNCHAGRYRKDIASSPAIE